MPANFFITVITILIFIVNRATAQKRWAGPSTGNWDEMINWQPQGVPEMTDDVILDNTFQKAAYIVIMPNTTVNVHTLLIEPVNNDSVELILPSSNKASPALIINGNGTSFNIRNGGVFRNSCGLTSGESIQLTGTISIYNGGRYIHNSRSSHATQLVAKLSAAAGTEKGIFEFDVPGGSYPISFSNRTYGTLILSSNASGGAQTYNASGTNLVVINGDFQVNNGVQFNLDLTKDMIVNNDYIQTGGVFNIASQPNNNVVKIKGNIFQSVSGTLSETSGGLPIIELNGDQNQQVAFGGSLLNSITLKINNQKGISLTAPLSIPYKLLLSDGVIKTSKTNLLTLLDNGTTSGGSVNSFIDGPVRKIGDDDFEFPVGKQGDYAPIKITGTGGAATDQYLAEYILGNPQQVYGNAFENPPMVRISRLEYWVLDRLAGSSSKKITVAVGNYSNATSLEKLVLAGWDVIGKSWKDEGNSFYSGIATGTLVSNEVNNFGAFTLGSTVEMQNLLPLNAVKLDAERSFDNIRLSWNSSNNIEPDHFEVEQSYNGVTYQKISSISFRKGVSDYNYSMPAGSTGLIYFRLKIAEIDGSYLYSETAITPEENVAKITFSIAHSSLRIYANENMVVETVITDISGRRTKNLKLALVKGVNNISINPDLAKGHYLICLYDNTGWRLGVGRFLIM